MGSEVSKTVTMFFCGPVLQVVSNLELLMSGVPICGRAQTDVGKLAILKLPKSTPPGKKKGRQHICPKTMKQVPRRP